MNNRGSISFEFLIGGSIFFLIFGSTLFFFSEIVMQMELELIIFTSLRESILESNAKNLDEVDENVLKRKLKRLSNYSFPLYVTSMVNNRDVFKVELNYVRKELFPIYFKKTYTMGR